MPGTMYQLARTMLDLKTDECLPPSLVDRLNRIEALTRECGGEVVSRQLVAMVIEQWERDRKVEQQAVDDEADLMP